jgi:hypothetical protein
MLIAAVSLPPAISLAGWWQTTRSGQTRQTIAAGVQDSNADISAVQ